MPAQPVIEGEFDAFQPKIIDTRNAHDVGRDFTRRVIALVFRIEVEVGQLHCSQTLPGFPGDTALEVAEILVPGAFDIRGELRDRHIERSGDLRQRCLIPSEFRWIGPHRGHRRAEGQRLQPTIVYDAAIRRYFHGTHGTGIALLQQKFPIIDRQERNPRGNGRASPQKQQRDEIQSPGFHRASFSGARWPLRFRYLRPGPKPRHGCRQWRDLFGKVHRQLFNRHPLNVGIGRKRFLFEQQAGVFGQLRGIAGCHLIELTAQRAYRMGRLYNGNGTCQHSGR